MQRRGVGRALIEESVNSGRRSGFAAIQCVALSAHTAKICRRVGMKTFNRWGQKITKGGTYKIPDLFNFSLEYSSYEQNGAKIFAAGGVDMGDHREGVIMAMKL